MPQKVSGVIIYNYYITFLSILKYLTRYFIRVTYLKMYFLAKSGI